MDEFEEIHDALKDVSNTTEQPPLSKEEQELRAREMGWVKPTPFDYDSFQAKDTKNWAAIAARYEWQDDFGDIGPSVPELERQLFHNDYITRVGKKLHVLNEIEVTCESSTRCRPVTQWDEAGLHPIMMENIRLCQFDRPTPVQSYGIPAVLNNRDLIGIAQTGSGKTGAFLIPILSKLMGKARKLAAPRPYVTEGFNPAVHGVCAEPLVLIVCPTRELATQIFDEARRLCYRSMMRPCVAYGGAPTRLQREDLQKGCDILIGTPGRILDFMGQPHVLSLRRVRYTVIDEADELLASDWEEDFQKLMSGGDTNEDADHVYMMFSATFNKSCRKLAKTYLDEDHVRIRVGRPGSSHLNISQQVHYVEENMKRQALYDLLSSMHAVRTLIFVNSKEEVDFVDDFLFNHGMPSTSIHSGRTQIEREDAIRAFRTAKAPLMVTTSVTARGLDIANVMHVINYDLPRGEDAIEQYVHRIGRTARIGNEGLATSFYNDRDIDIAADLVKILIECKQAVPDFLESYKPENEELVFDDNSDESQNGEAENDGWGVSDKATETQDNGDHAFNDHSAESVKQESVQSDEKPAAAPSYGRSPSPQEQLTEASHAKKTWPPDDLVPKASRSSLEQSNWANRRNRVW